MKIARKAATVLAATFVALVGVVGVSAPAHADISWGYGIADGSGGQ